MCSQYCSYLLLGKGTGGVTTVPSKAQIRIIVIALKFGAKFLCD